ncbi:MAG: hypothetical protein CMA80_00800 [Euryarchaeota archaeon]|nr:hypothetical protein [Euryarchaeota archaeon]
MSLTHDRSYFGIVDIDIPLDQLLDVVFCVFHFPSLLADFVRLTFLSASAPNIFFPDENIISNCI